jgi:hypothetical protein
LVCRVIPLPTAADEQGMSIGKAAFFPVPRDPEGSFASYKPGGRGDEEWFMSKTYPTYQQGLAALPSSSTTVLLAAPAAVNVEPNAAVSQPQPPLVAAETLPDLKASSIDVDAADSRPVLDQHRQAVA